MNSWSFRQAFFSIFLKGSSALVTVVFTLAISNLFDPENAGEIFTLITILIFCSVLSRMGLGILLTKELATYKLLDRWTDVYQIYSSSVLIVALASLFASGLLFAGSEFFAQNLFKSQTLEYPLKILSFAILPFSLFWIHGHCFQAIGSIYNFYFFQLLGFYLLTLTGVVFLGFADRLLLTDTLTVAPITWIILATSLLLLFISTSRWKKKLLHIKFTRPSVDFSLLAKSKNYYFLTIINFLFLWLPQLLVAGTATAKDVSEYTISMRVGMLMTMIMMAVNSYSQPKIAKLYAEGKKTGLRSVVWKANGLSACLSAPLLLMFLLFPNHILNIFGANYANGTYTLVTLSLGQFIYASTGSNIALLSMTNAENKATESLAIALVTMVLVSIALHGSLGSLGVAIAQTISLLIFAVYSSAQVNRRISSI